VELKEN